MNTIDTSAIFKDWSATAAYIRKPKLDEACKVIESLCIEVIRLEKELVIQGNRQDIKEQTYKTMMIEVQNVIHKYV